jgi:hypothetical protein
VVPSERVTSRVIVRERPDTRSPEIGSLRPGESAEYLGSVTGWHRARLANGDRGFVSKGWTRLVAPEPVVARPAPEPSTPAAPVSAPSRPSVLALLGSAANAVVAAFRPEPAVDLVLRDPEPEQRFFQHTEPTLPVSGFARPTGSTGEFEIAIVIDASTSTNEFAETDVDGDGVAEDEWAGDDSIFQAEVAAAAGFVHELRRLPGNHRGTRLRIAVVTFSGDDGFYRRPEDADFEPTRASLLALAERDARLVAPLSDDYDAILAALEELSRTRPSGMTNIAAGLAKALLALRRAEPGGEGARPGARRVVNFLTDGTPSLPYDRPEAERAAEFTARVLGRAGVRLNLFKIGRNAVTRRADPSFERMMRWTSGRYVELDDPSDLVAILNGTALGYVDRVRLANRTLKEDSGSITTGIDGSFYGEVPLRVGENEIEIEATLHDGRSQSQRFAIEYRVGPPDHELRARLARIRAENAALVAQLKKQLALEMARSRRREPQEKALELSVEERARP